VNKDAHYNQGNVILEQNNTGENSTNLLSKR